MDYKPRYAQPFTFKDALSLPVDIISEEITRLQYSVNKLQETQKMLNAYLEIDSSDPEITAAIEENKLVIGSQEERVSILKQALTQKGIHVGAHYDLPSTITTKSPAQPTDNNTSEPMPEDSSGLFL